MWTIESDTKTVVRKESCWRVPGVQVVGNGAKYKSAQKKKKKKKNRVKVETLIDTRWRTGTISLKALSYAPSINQS